MLSNSNRPPKYASEIKVSSDMLADMASPDHDISPKLKEAYVRERLKQERTEVELNRSRVVMVDQHGRFIKMPFLIEH